MNQNVEPTPENIRNAVLQDDFFLKSHGEKLAAYDADTLVRNQIIEKYNLTQEQIDIADGVGVNTYFDDDDQSNPYGQSVPFDTGTSASQSVEHKQSGGLGYHYRPSGQ